VNTHIQEGTLFLHCIAMQPKKVHQNTLLLDGTAQQAIYAHALT
jgi:hypothetical protein